MIASARMYEWTPSLTAAWRRLLDWVAQRAEVRLEVVESRSVSLDELWAREDLGCVFMCGYPYALRERRPALLAAPVPSPPRYGARPVYVTDFIVRGDRSYRTLEDTFGGRLAYSTEHSHSGYNAARYHLRQYRSVGRDALYAEVKGPYGRQRAVIQTILDGEADVGAIDGYAHDLLRRHDPATAAGLRTVATTDAAPSPPLVASPAMGADERARLTRALVTAHQVPELAVVLEDLLLLRFERVEERAFQVFLDWERAAAAAGYPRLR
ncbi:MAG TPA: PhnD/SsuA/transferrin family substrate-binding protein [Methylomirabilota bacterium]|nr:PhnD/SsuA/transferrin family substrate-binding protein [Methylomirabilota bacterium]